MALERFTYVHYKLWAIIDIFLEWMTEELYKCLQQKIQKHGYLTRFRNEG